MTTLAFVLKAFKATVQFLAGAVVLTYKGKKHTFEDDKYFSRWQVTEEHFCNAFEQLRMSPWCDYISAETLEEAAAQPDEPYIFDALEAINALVAQAVEDTRNKHNRVLQKMDIGEFMEKGEKPELLAGFDCLTFPTANVAKRYFFSFIDNLPVNADWKDGEATITFTESPSGAIQAMIDLISEIIEDHSWTIAKETLEPTKPKPRPFASSRSTDEIVKLPDQQPSTCTIKTGATPSHPEEAYTMEQACTDLLEKWEEDINTRDYKLFLRSGLVAGDHMGPALAKTIWKEVPEEAEVEEFLSAIAASIQSKREKFKTTSEARLGLRGAATMVLARKAQLDLSGGILTKK